jgi:hypothetical protein
VLRKRRVETTDSRYDSRYDTGHGTGYDTAPGLAEARHRFGGLDLPAALAGMVAALGTAVLLAGLAGAAGSVGYDRGTGTDTLSNAAIVAGMVVLFLSFLVGGWVAGRMARYDGPANGVLSAVLFIALAVGLTALGNWLDDKYNFLGNVNLPNWFTGPSTSTRVVSAVIGILVVLLASMIGGAIGSRYHHRADRLIAVTRPAGDSLVTGDADVAMHRSEDVRAVDERGRTERTETAPKHARH